MTRTEKVRILAASKHFERRVMAALGYRRWINDGSAHSDSDPRCPLAVEATRSKSPWRHARRKWAQAVTNAATEQRPPLLVQGEPGRKIDDALFTCEGRLFLPMWRAYALSNSPQRIEQTDEREAA